MKRILSFILILALTAGLFVMPVSAEETKAEALTEAEEVMAGLGFLNKADYNPHGLLSRADFAMIMSEICGFVSHDNASSGIEIAFGEDNKDQLITDSGARAFDDIDTTMKEYDAICAMSDRGYMNGITSYLFGPYYDITAGEVIKVLVSMLGRDNYAVYEGGYPQGYMTVARKLKLTSGVAVNYKDFVTYRDVFGLIYNAFDINVYEFSGITADGGEEYLETDETFLNRCAGIFTLEGNMTDNGITTYYDESSVGEDMVIIGGQELYIGSADYARDYLGRELVAYYKETESEDKILLYAVPYNDKTKTFGAEDFVSYSSSAIKFFDEDGKQETVSISGANIIYNNTVLDRYNSDTFKFLFGDVTLVSTKGTKNYDVVIINDYMVGRITKVSATDSIVYAETPYKSMSGIRAMDLSTEEGKTVIITDTDGNRLSADGLSKGNVISVVKSDDNSYINIRVCSAGVRNFKVADYSLEEDLTISDGETSYIMRGVDRLSDNVNVKPGELYDLYLDYQGNLVYLEALADSTNLNRAILLGAARSSTGLADSYAVKLYTQNEQMLVLDLEEKLIINHSSKKAADAISELQASIDRVVLYREDKETGVLKAIVTPLEFGAEDTDNRGWYTLIPNIRLSANEGESEADHADYLKEECVNNRFTYEGNGNMLDKSLRYKKDSATLFAVPGTKEEYDEERKFIVNRLKLENGKGYYMNAYDTDLNSLAPDTLVTTTGGSGAVGDIPGDRVLLISKVVNTVNADEENAKAYKGYLMEYNSKDVSEVTYTVSTEVGYYDRTGAPIEDAPEPEAGDVIRFSTNTDGDIQEIFMSYDMSLGVAYPYGDKYGDNWFGSDSYAGYVYNVDGDYLRVVSQEPHLVPDNAAERYVYFSDRANSIVQQVGNQTLIVEEGRNGITVRIGTREDIISFEDTGAQASGTYDKYVGFEYSWGYTIGNIIYRN